jgi:hypothetical protein
MRLRRLKMYAIGAGGMLVLVMAILLLTGWSSAVAAQITNVFVTNDASHPVPVHEQGTANVNVTNSSLPATGNRSIQIASHLESANDTFVSPWVDTHDCRRFVGYSYSSQYSYQLDLQVTADPSLANGDALRAYPGIQHQGDYHVYEYTMDAGAVVGSTDPQPDGQPIVAPYSRVRIALVGANVGIHDESAYLYCVR